MLLAWGKVAHFTVTRSRSLSLKLGPGEPSLLFFSGGACLPLSRYRPVGPKNRVFLPDSNCPFSRTFLTLVPCIAIPLEYVATYLVVVEVTGVADDHLVRLQIRILPWHNRTTHLAIGLSPPQKILSRRLECVTIFWQFATSTILDLATDHVAQSVPTKWSSNHVVGTAPQCE